MLGDIYNKQLKRKYQGGTERNPIKKCLFSRQGCVFDNIFARKLKKNASQIQLRVVMTRSW